MESGKYESMLSLFGNVFICGNEVDSHIWKLNPSGMFSAIRPLQGSGIFFSNAPPCAQVWMGLATPRVEVFCWLPATNKVSTIDNLRRKGLALKFASNNCCLCRKEREKINHLFMQHNFSYHI